MSASPPLPFARQFNLPLFRKLGELGLLGLTVAPEYGGSGMDAVAGEGWSGLWL